MLFTKFKEVAYFVLFSSFVLLAACTPTTAGSTTTLFVDSKLVDCVGAFPQTCMLTRTDANGAWEYFYDSIEGFAYEEGFVYELRVNLIDVPNPPADASSVRFELVEVISKVAIEVESSGTDVYVDRLEVMIMESFPVQASVLVQGNLANGCVVLDGILAERRGNEFVLTINSHREGDMCTEALVPFEQNVPLDVDGLKAGTYSVLLGDVSAEFTLDIDNVDGNGTIDPEKSDSVIMLERTACFGTCPIYTVTIYGEGRVVYNGIDFVDVVGEQEIGINPKLVSELVEFMVNGGYLDLQDEYTNYNVTDMPSAISSLTVNGETKRVDHYFGDDSAPIVLRQIENKIDELANSAQWTGSDPSANNREAVWGSISVRGTAGNTVDLPAGAVLTVRLEDVSLQDAPSVVISDRSYPEVTQLPTFYDLAFDLYEIDPNGMYAVSAEVLSASGELLYATDTIYSVLTQGMGNMAEVELISVQ